MAFSHNAMSLKPRPEDYPVLVRLLRIWRGDSQKQLAKKTGLSESTIRRYEAGKSTLGLGRTTVELIAHAQKVPLFVVDFFLLPAIAAERQARSLADLDLGAAVFRRLALRLQGVGHLLAGAPLGLGDGGTGPQSLWSPPKAVRDRALELWKNLEDCSDAERWSLVESWKEYQHPGLAELLCHLSEEAASDRADRALALAKLAHRVAQLAPGIPLEKKRLLGYSLIFLTNALRVAGKLQAARERFQEGLASWLAGEGGATFLMKWRVLDLEASLLRDERQFALALSRLDKVLAIAPAEAGRILLKISAVYDQMGDGERAIEVLRKAEQSVDRDRDPRLVFGIRFNLATALCLLDQFEEAEEMYPEIEELASGLQKQLDNVRLKWLAGRIAAGRGRLDEAEAALDEVRQEFTKRRSAWDCSLVTLELATVRLRQGRKAEVQPLSLALVWVFDAQGIHDEAMAALALFRDAAERDQATADLTERIVRYLRRAQGDPRLRFSAEPTEGP